MKSITHAANMVRIEPIRTWASPLMFSKMKDKPRGLMITAVIRAKVCERFGEAFGEDRKATYFTVGLLSVLDAILDCSMSRALKLFSLSDEICEALLYRQGDLGRDLKSVLAYERSDWDNLYSVISQTPRSGSLSGFCHVD